MTCPRCETVLADGKCLNCGYPKPEQGDAVALLRECRAMLVDASEFVEAVKRNMVEMGRADEKTRATADWRGMIARIDALLSPAGGAAGGKETTGG